MLGQLAQFSKSLPTFEAHLSGKGLARYADIHTGIPTRGYSLNLLDGISPPDTEGFSSFHIILHTMSPLIPRR